MQIHGNGRAVDLGRMLGCRQNPRAWHMDFCDDPDRDLHGDWPVWLRDLESLKTKYKAILRREKETKRDISTRKSLRTQSKHTSPSGKTMLKCCKNLPRFGRGKALERAQNRRPKPGLRRTGPKHMVLSFQIEAVGGRSRLPRDSGDFLAEIASSVTPTEDKMQRDFWENSAPRRPRDWSSASHNTKSRVGVNSSSGWMYQYQYERWASPGCLHVEGGGRRGTVLLLGWKNADRPRGEE